MTKPETKTLNVSETRAQFSALLNDVHRGDYRVLVDKNGIPVAAIVSPLDLQRLKRIDKQIEDDLKFMEEMREPFKDIPPEEIEAEVERAIKRVRAEMRAERLAKTNT